MTVYRGVAVPPLADFPLRQHLVLTQDQLARVFGDFPSFSLTGAAANDTLRFDGTNWVNTSLLQVTATEARISHATNAALDFYVGGTRRAGVSVIASDVLRFTDSAGTVKLQLQLAGNTLELIPPSTSFVFRNTADSADNLVITDAGSVTVRTSAVVGTDPTGTAILRVGGTVRLNDRVGIGGDIVANVQVQLTQAVGSKGLVIAGGTQTTNQPVLDLAQTWNAGAVTFHGIKLNVTNTASASASRLLTLQVGASEKFYVQTGGSFGAPGIATFGSGAATINALLTIDSASGQVLQVNGDGSSVIGVIDNGTHTLNILSYTGLDFSWGTLTTDRQIIQADTTWNAAGVAFRGVRINIVNTASAAGSRILDLEENSTSKFAVDVSGFLYIAGTKVLGTRVTGYTAMTGAANRGTSYATSTITLQQLAERMKALQDDLTTHGAIGA